MFVRKNYRRLTDVERARFVQALYHVKDVGIVDQFADIHETHFDHTIHESSHFLPWHREMLLRFENALRTHPHHREVTIPYWDSTVDRSPSDPLWANSFLGQFNSAWGLGREFGAAASSSSLSTREQVEQNQWRNTYDEFWPELESSIHNTPHRWVGGVMNTSGSPGDPVFYLHHCWIDMLWARWQLTHPVPPPRFVASVLRETFGSGPAVARLADPSEGVGLNDPLEEWNDRTPALVQDHHALGYRYDTDPPDAVIPNLSGALSLLLGPN